MIIIPANNLYPIIIYGRHMYNHGIGNNAKNASAIMF